MVPLNLNPLSSVCLVVPLFSFRPTWARAMSYGFEGLLRMWLCKTNLFKTLLMEQL